MTFMKFTGPGDLMTLDGMEIKRGDVVELDELQIRRLRDAGAQLEPTTAPSARPATKTPATPVKEDN